MLILGRDTCRWYKEYFGHISVNSMCVERGLGEARRKVITTRLAPLLVVKRFKTTSYSALR